jgi:hypothetical protein
MLDRVAAAIAFEDIGRIGEFRSHDELWSEISDDSRTGYRRMAKAAMASLQPEDRG